MYEKVLGSIDSSEVVELALALGNIDSPAGFEQAAADYVYEWLRERGWSPAKVGLVPGRYNIAARLRGRGDGPTLVFNSHLDTSVAADETLSTRHAADPVYHAARLEGEYLVGHGVCNNKGPMAAWLVAAECIRRSGIELRGDLVLTAVVGEIGTEPIDEFQGPQHVSKDIGTRYVIARGYVGDYALVAEGTDFGVGWVEAGKAFFKLSIFGNEPPIYTPYVSRSEELTSHPNAIVRAVPVIQALEQWAAEYERKHVFESGGGTVIPKVSIGAIRGGLPYKITKTAQVCELFIDVRLTPVQKPTEVERELRRVLNEVGVPFELTLYTYRRGFVGSGVEKLVQAVERAHQRIFGRPLEKCKPVYTSMWRDINPFNEAGIPAVMYGPGSSVGHGGTAIRVEDLVNAARAYALIALELCGAGSED